MKSDTSTAPASRAPFYRELLRHSGVYGVGLLLGRVASFVLLPLYTSYLSPAEYGVIALLDLGTMLLGQLCGAGIHAAVMRESFNPKFSPASRLWSTGLSLTTLLTLPVVLLIWTFRDVLSQALLGPEIADGPRYVGLCAGMVLPQVLVGYMQNYARAQKRSTFFVTMSVSGLVARIFLNVLFIAGLRLGVLGFLLSALIVSGLETLVYGVILFGKKPFAWMRESIEPLLRYGLPIMAAGLASLSMHQLNRGLLRFFDVDLASIGLYALAYTIAQAGSTLVLEPFHAIWSLLVFEADRHPDRLRIFQRVYDGLLAAVFLVQLGLALASRPLIRLVAAPDYASAAGLLPWICLAFFFFPLHTMFRIPAMLHRKTGMVALVAIAAALVNLVLNFILIPRFGVLGACWSSIATYAAFSLGGHLLYRRLENLRFPLITIPVTLLIAGGTFLLQKELLSSSSLAVQILGAAAFWLVGGMILLRAVGFTSPASLAQVWQEIRTKRD